MAPIRIRRAVDLDIVAMVCGTELLRAPKLIIVRILRAVQTNDVYIKTKTAPSACLAGAIQIL